LDQSIFLIQLEGEYWLINLIWSDMILLTFLLWFFLPLWVVTYKFLGFILEEILVT
jgi:hypothetical protein